MVSFDVVGEPMPREQVGHPLEERLLRLNTNASQNEIHDHRGIRAHRRKQRQELADLGSEGEAALRHYILRHYIIKGLDAKTIA
jgi:hypothetical protein